MKLAIAIAALVVSLLPAFAGPGDNALGGSCSTYCSPVTNQCETRCH